MPFKVNYLIAFYSAIQSKMCRTRIETLAHIHEWTWDQQQCGFWYTVKNSIWSSWMAANMKVVECSTRLTHVVVVTIESRNTKLLWTTMPKWWEFGWLSCANGQPTSINEDVPPRTSEMRQFRGRDVWAPQFHDNAICATVSIRFWRKCRSNESYHEDHLRRHTFIRSFSIFNTNNKKCFDDRA